MSKIFSDEEVEQLIKSIQPQEHESVSYIKIYSCRECGYKTGGTLDHKSRVFACCYEDEINKEEIYIIQNIDTIPSWCPRLGK